MWYGCLFRSRWREESKCPHLLLALYRRLYHPESCPLDTLSFTDANGAFNVRTDNISSHVADDGTLHIVAGGLEGAAAAFPVASAKGAHK